MMLPRPVGAAPEVELRPWRPGTWLLMVTAAALGGLLIGLAISLWFGRSRLEPYEYHLWRWEADNLTQIAFSRMGIGPDPNQAEGEAAIRQYFKITSEIGAASQAENPNLALLDTLENERASYTNDVQAAIERYIDEQVEEEGLQTALPLFSSMSMTWPPVSFELTSPPRLLVRSPRDIIKRDGDTLLKPGLSLRDAEKIEAETASDTESTLVVTIGGLAAYPAIVSDDRSYDSLLNTAAHEWTHHYLAFFPLGQDFYSGQDGIALNETTANVVGDHMGDLIRKAHPLALPVGADGNAPQGPAPTVDFNKEMHALRLKVDALLKDGKVDEAEKAMNDERDYLAQHGVTIRKLNQAYFAFYGSYGDSAASSDPIGPKVQQVWDLTQDVGVFLRNMREVSSVADLDKLISKLQGASK
jgi:hypothetical protein